MFILWMEVGVVWGEVSMGVVCGRCDGMWWVGGCRWRG